MRLPGRTGLAAIVLGGLLAGCSGSSGLPLLPATPGLAPSGSIGVASSHVAAIDRDSLRRATVAVASGATNVNVTVAKLSGKLLTAATPITSSQEPAVALSPDGVATVQLASPGGGGGISEIDVVLDSSVLWTIELAGGATEENVNMRGGRLALLDLAAGTSGANVILPARNGTQVVREVGGASELTVSTPRSVSSRVQVSGGAGSVQIGAVTHTGVGGSRTFAEPGYLSAPQRLDVELVGGVSRVRVTTRAAAG
jgi:hypothetical protein